MGWNRGTGEQGNRRTGEETLGMRGTLGHGQETMTGLMLQRKAYLAD